MLTRVSSILIGRAKLRICSVVSVRRPMPSAILLMMSISPSESFPATLVFKWSEYRRRPARGFLTSCATCAATRPSAEIFSLCIKRNCISAFSISSRLRSDKSRMISITKRSLPVVSVLNDAETGTVTPEGVSIDNSCSFDSDSELTTNAARRTYKSVNIPFIGH